MRSIRVLLADDNPEFLHAMEELLQCHPGIEVVGRAESGHTALAEAARLRPDLVLLSWALFPLNGLQVLALLKSWANPPRAIVMTVLHDLPWYREAALAAGADGFLCKAEVSERLPLLIADLQAQMATNTEGGCSTRENDRSRRE